jgi:uncharacterized protein YbjT (DUF2867 family)
MTSTIVIAGGHGKIALRLARLLSARGDSVRSLIRNPGHQAGVRAVGAEPMVADMEALDSLAEYVEGADGVVFAAGAGPGSGAERKRTVDFLAAVKIRDAALATGVRRYLMVSSIGAGDPASGPESMRPYLQAKADADAALAASELDWTIVRPGMLTDDPGTGMVRVGESLERDAVTRDDVAAVLAGCLDEPRSVHKTFELMQGETPIAEALAAL